MKSVKRKVEEYKRIFIDREPQETEGHVLEWLEAAFIDVGNKEYSRGLKKGFENGMITAEEQHTGRVIN